MDFVFMSYKDCIYTELKEYYTYKKNISIEPNDIPDAYDALFKYYNIIKKISKHNIGKSINLLEPGCKYCTLSSFLSLKYSFNSAYLFDLPIVSGKNISEIQKNYFKKTNTKLNFYPGNFYKTYNNILDNSIDLIIDGCSVTHFCGNGLNSGITSWNKFKKVCDLKLKKNGICVISTDVKYNKDIQKTGANGEYIYPMDLINIFSRDYEIIEPILSIEHFKNGLRIMCFSLKKR
jgi:hypothetical protein